MKVRILGTAAGGGLPQWNCGCEVCGQARATNRHRTQDCLAITGDGSTWYLVNASADLRGQLLASPELAPPPGTRATPVAGVLLTSAELDHTLGLLTLREADRLAVWATPTVRAALPFGPVLESYTFLDWQSVTPGEPIPLQGGLTALAFAAGDKRPRYASTPDNAQWTVAYRFTDARTGGVLVYAPGLAAWTATFTAGIAGADVVLLDGTFATNHEFASTGMGHLSMEDSLPLVRANPGPRYMYTHLNNTNPYAGEPLALADGAASVATDGELLVL